MIRRLTIVLVILAAVTALAVSATAGCVVRQRNAIVVNNVAAAAVVTPVITPIVTPIAAYGASYTNDQDIDKLKQEIAALKAEHQSRIAILETARDNLAARLAVLEAKAGITPPPAPKVEQPKVEAKVQPKGGTPVAGNLPAAYFKNGCVQCHTANRNPKGGLSLVAADGKTELAQSCEMRLEILRRINLEADDTHVMPPRGSKFEPVSDVDSAELLERLTRNLNAAPKK